ncbi:4-hydroxy-tetrahydrodipicolinate reductase [Bartonella tamiae]|uniref:4-hydroxy-tetrahydrodipicolinate reductase n=1 Tax=Bartonella tamiae Th239 TaxID=1094558 RepID=J1K035_9HYPH|nr:4-hydroxy-tetrahydrodipicolinate reductase [Bartonella tamiae]EJF90370.1 dihydrodipicolinate reductase [Bartonella tamiae Th239]EJF93686.1 dihydrodipicolinate reductase [Bartonella tamiae Th307]
MRLAVVGANGKMGGELIRAVKRIDGVTLSAAIVRQGSSYVGQDVNILVDGEKTGIIITDDPLPALAQSDGILDFTQPEASVMYAGFAAQARIVHIIGTTGFNPDQENKIQSAAAHAKIVKSGNMSLGVNLLAGLVHKAAQALSPNDYDIEISEMHHRRKIDAPSGTALLLGKAAANGRGVDLKKVGVYGRDGIMSPRQDGEIGFAALRGGTVIGDHSVIFAGTNERLVLSHFAQERSIFADGAVKAALWAYKQEKGLFSMLDVLGLND